MVSNSSNSSDQVRLRDLCVLYFVVFSSNIILLVCFSHVLFSMKSPKRSKLKAYLGLLSSGRDPLWRGERQMSGVPSLIIYLLILLALLGYLRIGLVWNNHPYPHDFSVKVLKFWTLWTKLAMVSSQLFSRWCWMFSDVLRSFQMFSGCSQVSSR